MATQTIAAPQKQKRKRPATPLEMTRITPSVAEPIQYASYGYERGRVRGKIRYCRCGMCQYAEYMLDLLARVERMERHRFNLGRIAEVVRAWRDGHAVNSMPWIRADQRLQRIEWLMGAGANAPADDPEPVQDAEDSAETQPQRYGTSLAMESMHDRALDQQRERVYKLTGVWVGVVERTEYDWEGTPPSGLMADLVTNVRYCLAKFDGATDKAARAAASEAAMIEPSFVGQWDDRAEDAAAIEE